MLEEHKPLVTDWLIASGALAGIPLAIWGIVTLFIRDRNKERHLTALENAATAQTDIIEKMQSQIDELAKHSSIFQEQSYLMLESNKLIEKQIEVQIAVFEHTKQTNEKKRELESLKRMESIRPYLRFEGMIAGPSGFTIRIINSGEDAFNLKLVLTNSNFIAPMSIPADVKLEKKGHFELHGHADPNKTTFGNSQVTFSGFIKYIDKDSNFYSQEIIKDTRAVRILDPVLDKQENN